jgi:hypothetical protein
LITVGWRSEVKERKRRVEEMSHPTKTFRDYMDEVIADHVIAEDEEQVILDVSRNEAEVFGLFLIRAVAGWARGLKRVRFLHQLAEPEATRDEGAINEEEIDEEEERKIFMN